MSKPCPEPSCPYSEGDECTMIGCPGRFKRKPRVAASNSNASPTMKGRDASRGGKGPVGESLLPTTPALVVGGFSGGRT